MELDGKKRKRLRLLAQEIEPVIYIGKNGISNELIAATNDELEHHELIKVRFSSHKDEKKEMGELLAEKTKSEIVGRIGHIIIFFKQNSDPEKRKIKL